MKDLWKIQAWYKMKNTFTIYFERVIISREVLLKFIIIVKEAVFQMFTITVHVFGWLLNKMGKAQRFDEASYV